MRIDHGAPPETTAGILGMESYLIGFDPEYFGDRHLVHGLKLRGDPRLALVTFKSDRRIQRLHRTVSQEWKFIFSYDTPRRRKAIHSFIITARDGYVAGGPSHFFVSHPQLFAVRMFHRGNIPIDFQKIAPLLGRPKSIGHHGHAATLHERQFENVSYSGQPASFRVVDRLDAPTEHRRMADDCDL